MVVVHRQRSPCSARFSTNSTDTTLLLFHLLVLSKRDSVSPSHVVTWVLRVKASLLLPHQLWILPAPLPLTSILPFAIGLVVPTVVLTNTKHALPRLRVALYLTVVLTRSNHQRPQCRRKGGGDRSLPPYFYYSLRPYKIAFVAGNNVIGPLP